MGFRRAVLAVLLFLVLLGGLSAGLHLFTQNNNLGTDFFIFWQSGRAVFLEHASPYSEELTIQSQLAIFKRLARPDEDHLTFAYPPFALLLILPLVVLPFDWAQAVWISSLILLLVSAFALGYPRAPRWVGPSFLVFYPVFFGLVLGNYAVLVTALLLVLLGLYQPREKPAVPWQIAAGFITAWLAVKPQFTWPFILLLGLSALRKRQWSYLGASGLSLLALLGLSFGLVPEWPREWFASLTNYAAYNQSWPIITSLLKLFIPVDPAIWLSAGLGILCLGMTAWYILRWWRNSMDVVALLAWLGFIGYLFHPRGVSYEQIIFLLPLAIWVCLNTSKLSIQVWGWWLASLLVSWAAFWISVSSGNPAATEWPFLFHSLWILWILIKSRSPTMQQRFS